MSRASAPVGIQFVRHPMRPEWGVGRVMTSLEGTIHVRFADGATRAFRGDVLVRAEDPGLDSLALPEDSAPPVETAPPAPKSRRKPASASAARPARRKPAK